MTRFVRFTSTDGNRLFVNIGSIINVYEDNDSASKVNMVGYEVPITVDGCFEDVISRIQEANE